MSSSSKPEFKFPWQYSFPPFFTLQPHAETRAKQLSAWRSLVLDYCQHGGIAAVDVADLARSPLFRNDAIGRRLDDKGCYLNFCFKLMLQSNLCLWSCVHTEVVSRSSTSKAVAVVLDDLASHGHLEWIDKAKKTRAHVFYRTPAQWGETIYAYAKDNGLVNAVCTMYELTESEEVEGQPFHNLDPDVLVKALKALELQKKAEIFGSNEGVKFF